MYELLSIPTKGLVIKKQWLDLILSGNKTWEIRGSNTKIRSEIALIQSGSGQVIGKAELIHSRLLTMEEYQSAENFHCIPEELRKEAPYKKIYAWELRNAIRFNEPVHYKHPQGAVIWVNLSEEIFL